MKPVQQTIFSKGKGNCYAACLATILELPLESVPNFCAMKGDWMDQANQWLSRCDLALWEQSLAADGSIPGWNALTPGMPVIVSGKSPRGDFFHAVVGVYARLPDGRHSLEYIHDPHPDGRFLASAQWATIFLAIHPERVAALRAVTKESKDATD